MWQELGFFITIYSRNFLFLQSFMTPTKTRMTVLFFLNRKQVCHIIHSMVRIDPENTPCVHLKTTKAQKYDLDELYSLTARPTQAPVDCHLLNHSLTAVSVLVPDHVDTSTRDTALGGVSLQHLARTQAVTFLPGKPSLGS